MAREPRVLAIDAGGTMTDTFVVDRAGAFVVGKAQTTPPRWTWCDEARRRHPARPGRREAASRARARDPVRLQGPRSLRPVRRPAAGARRLRRPDRAAVRRASEYREWLVRELPT